MLRTLRERLANALRTDSDFEAFCQDFFPHVRERFSPGMDRVAKTNLLFDIVRETDQIIRRLDQIAVAVNSSAARQVHSTSAACATPPLDAASAGPPVAHEKTLYSRGRRSDQLRLPRADYDPRWHIPRPDPERKALNKLARVGEPVILQAPECYGKAWMVQRIISRIAQQDAAGGQHTEVARFNLRKDQNVVPATLEILLVSLLRSILEQLKISNVEKIVSKVSRIPGGPGHKFCSILEQHVLDRPSTRFLLLLEEADHLYGSKIAQDFFALLRSMCENRTQTYQKLRLFVTVGVEAGLLETVCNSPFFGLTAAIVLDAFSLDQLRSAATLYGLDPADPGLTELLRVTGGHPDYSRLAIHEAVFDEKPLLEALGNTDVRGGPFAARLQSLRSYVESEGLQTVICAILNSPRFSVPIDPYLRLYRKGLVLETKPGEYHLRCPLFEDYFRARYL